ncbi:MAG: adenylate/guanylate cyclase domain-containing protein [Burkholderiales bacterium]
MARDVRRLAAIVSADVVGYSLLMGRDESATLSSLKAHRRELIDPKIAEYGGRIVKTTGDGLLLEFPSVVDAVRCAVDVQRGMAERNAGVAPDDRIRYRIGINVGDIIIDGDDIFGDGVNVAARLEALAEPGGICVSRAVRDQVLDKLNFAFDDLGPQEVKNIVRPVEVYRVALDAEEGSGLVRVAATPSATRGARSSRRVWLVASAIAIGLAALSWAALQSMIRPAAIEAYSAQDRRMTFAVLPFQPPAGDSAGAQVAAAMTDAAFAAEEHRPIWAQLASRKAVQQAIAKHAADRDVASELGVHFLIRGTVTPAAPGYSLAIMVVDGSTERVIDSRTLAIGNGTITPRLREEFEGTMGRLTYRALQVEVQRALVKANEALDVRDLSFRAYVEWNEKKGQRDEKGAYVTATDLLNRALALAPDDLLALRLMAQVNLCDCVNAWSRNPEEQQAIGASALERYLQKDPRSESMLVLKSQLYALHGRFEESLALADSVLKRDPDDITALSSKAYALMKMGKPREALAVQNLVLERNDYWNAAATAAAIHYALGDYDQAVRLAQQAMTEMRRDDLANPNFGTVALTLIAAEGRLGRVPQAKAALADFKAAVPGVGTIAAIKAWMHPTAELAGSEALYDGLRLAGVPD